MLCVLLFAASARAQSNSAERTLAEALFREGRELVEQERWAEACPKFAESQRLDPGTGTLLNLAVCHEKVGRTATAWAEFREALALAKRDGRQDRAELAQRHIEVLEGQLARVTIDIPGGARVAGMQVELNGAPLGEAAWGTPIPTDPGKVVIEVRAPEHQAYRVTFQLEPARTRDVHVRGLEPLTEQETQGPSAEATPDDAAAGQSITPKRAPADADRAAHEGFTGSPRLAYLIGGAGFAVLGVGSVFGIRAIQMSDDAAAICARPTGCTEDAERVNDQARLSATLANVGIGVGVAAIGVAAYLWLTHDSAPPKSTRAARHSPARHSGGTQRSGAAERLSASADLQPGRAFVEVSYAF